MTAHLGDQDCFDSRAVFGFELRNRLVAVSERQPLLREAQVPQQVGQ